MLIGHTTDQSYCVHVCTYYSTLTPRDSTHAQSALTSTFDVDTFLLNLLSRSRLCASIQSSSTLPSITVVSGKTKLSARNLQNSLCPIWACRQLQHCDSGTTRGGSGGSRHLRPVASDSVQRVTITAVRVWPQEWVVAWVVWHISFG